MKNLYTLTDEIAELEELHSRAAAGEVTEDPDGNPVTPEEALERIGEALDALQCARDDKALGIACMIKNARAESEALGQEVAALLARKHTATKRMEWLKTYLATAIQPGTKLKDGRAHVYWSKSERTVVECEPEDLPEEFQRVKREANLSAIKAALRGGREIPGATLQTKQNVIIK